MQHATYTIVSYRITHETLDDLSSLFERSFDFPPDFLDNVKMDRGGRGTICEDIINS